MSLLGSDQNAMAHLHEPGLYTATGNIDPRHMVVLVDSSAGAVTLTLPRLHQWIGQIMTIEKVGSGTNDILLAVPGNEAVNYQQIEAAGINLNAAGDRICLYNNGRSITILANDIS